MIPYDLQYKINKCLIFVGVIIVIYSVLWILVVLGFIPKIVVALFPQIGLLIVGLFIIYMAYMANKNL
ncbi:hypothetical protein BGI41_04705 [Methanobrevibacter sp. 87.7]|uniref:hypothetical protein n=1 Tax=Methanobrevibacter sp. 87.7 TaxID=387957 RepID=UPI000B5008D6|nr:hypothetical protein [Methanobrevibacter sp. 87.7]OWT32993.1 hypothetical protein BGI41_04705 [Methanobrevibacter sp. 87.7]